jgi:hypothetical protein
MKVARPANYVRSGSTKNDDSSINFVVSIS